MNIRKRDQGSAATDTGSSTETISDKTTSAQQIESTHHHQRDIPKRDGARKDERGSRTGGATGRDEDVLIVQQKNDKLLRENEELKQKLAQVIMTLINNNNDNGLFSTCVLFCLLY